MELYNTLSSRALKYLVIGRHWASDLEFFNIESAFFKKLLDRYFLDEVNKAGAARLSEVSGQLGRLTANVHNAQVRLDEQLRHLELMAEDIIPEDTEELTGKQVQLEYLVTTIMREYRETKKLLFSLITGSLERQRKVTF